jgi:hypothetical protein
VLPEPPDPEPPATGALGTGTPGSGEFGDGLAVMVPDPEPAWVNPPATGENEAAAGVAMAAECPACPAWLEAPAGLLSCEVDATAWAPAGETVK